MATWIKGLFVAPHVVVFIGIILTVISEIIRYQGDKNKKVFWETMGLVFLISSLAITGVGGLWAAKQQASFEKKILGSITGGDSYCYLIPMVDGSSGFGSFILRHVGEYPVYDITVQILNKTKLSHLPFHKIKPPVNVTKEQWEEYENDHDIMGEFIHLQAKATETEYLSILTPTSGFRFGRFQLPQNENEQDYLISIWSRGGYVTQQIRFKRILSKNNNWGYSMRVAKQVSTDGQIEVLYEQIVPKIPL